MSPTIHTLYYGLWFAHPVLQTSVVWVMLQRKRQQKFPVFFAYVVAQIVVFSVVFLASSKGTYREFFYSYWITAALSLALGFCVIYEIFLDVFRPYHTLKDLGTVLFKWASLVMLLVAGVVAAASPTSDEGPLVQSVLTVQRCVRVIQCGLVLFLLLFSRYLGVSRKQQSFGISMGFGLFAAVELFVGALLAAGHVNGFVLPIANMMAYNFSILVWLGYMWSKDEARDPSASLLVSQRWEQSFMDLQHPMPADSLIPMFENMVEQAISRVHEPQPDNPPPPEAPAETERTLEEIVNASLAPAERPTTKLANSAAASSGTSAKS
jgi:hypothetical protein